MRVSISLPEEEVEFPDAYAGSKVFVSPSAVAHKAVRLLGEASVDGQPDP